MKHIILSSLILLLSACGGSGESVVVKQETTPTITETIDLSLGTVLSHSDDNTTFHIPVAIAYSGSNTINHDVHSSNRNLVKTNYFNGNLTIDSRDLIGKESEVIDIVYTVSDGNVSDTVEFSFTLNNTTGQCEVDCGGEEENEEDEGETTEPEDSSILTLYLEREFEMNENSNIMLPFTINYINIEEVVLEASIDVESDIAEVSISDGAIHITSKNLRGLDPLIINLTLVASVEDQIKTIVQQIKILNNIADTFGVSIEPLLSMDENSEQLIDINLNYDGLATPTHTISEDNDYLYALIQNNQIRIITQHIPLTEEKIVKLTLVSKAARQTIETVFDITINNTIPDTVSIKYQKIPFVNENTEIILPIETTYLGSDFITYGITSNNTSLIQASIDSNEIILRSNNHSNENDIPVKITVTAIADGVFFTESFEVTVLDYDFNGLSLTTNGLTMINESDTSTANIYTDYSGNGVLSYDAYLNNNANATISISNGVVSVNTSNLTGDNNQDLVAYISVTDGVLYDLLEIPFTLINTVSDTLNIKENSFNYISELATLTLPFPIEYDGEQALTYEVESDNLLLEASILNGVLTITTFDVPNTDDLNVNLTLSVSNGVINDSHIFQFTVLNNTPDLLEISIGDHLVINENTTTRITPTLNKKLSLPITYNVSSSNEELVDATIEDGVLILTSQDKSGAANEAITITVTAIQDTLQSTASLNVVLHNNIADFLELNVDTYVSLPENSSVLLDTTLNYNGGGTVTYTVSTNNEFINATIDDNVLSIVSNNISGDEDTKSVVTIFATDGFLSKTTYIQVDIINNESDELSVTLNAPNTMNQNSSINIPIEINYSGNFIISQQINVSDGNLASVLIENNILTINTNNLLNDTNQVLTITLIFTDNTVSHYESFSLIVESE
jgi:hypothetical protein